MKTVAVIGASTDRAKFGNKAVRAFMQAGYQVFPINPRVTEVEGLPAFPSISAIPVRPDLVSVYLPAPVVLKVLPEIAAKGCDELWLNPGTESPEVLAEAERLGLNIAHISYTMIYVDDFSRQGILRAMKQRRTYAATDNILADSRCRAGGQDHLMGEAFTSSEPPQLRIKLIGTGPLAKVTFIKDDVEVNVVEPRQAEIDLTWTDPHPLEGKTSYYYVRGEQTDGELVWASPMWITYSH